MSVSLTLDRHAVTVEPTVGALFPKPTGGPLFTLDPAVVATARELQALVDAARRLVTVDPAWALWALECAVDAEYPHDLEEDDTLRTALRLLEAGVDRLYLAERRSTVAAASGGAAFEQIDRKRLDSALDRIGHRSSPMFRVRIADAYDASEAVA
jgi:hypothetical protein